MKILVTGANGFLGTYLIQELVAHKINNEEHTSNKQYQPVCFVRQKKKENIPYPNLEDIEPNINIIQGDITNKDDVVNAAKGCHAVIHLAASVSSFDFQRNYDVNVKGAENIVAACKQNHIKRVVFVSSFTALTKDSNYGMTKLQAEEVFNKYSSDKNNTGLDITILQPAMIYGKGGKGFTKMVKNVKSLLFIIPIIGTGKYKRQPVYVEDMVKAIVICLEKPTTINKTYYISGPETLTFKEMLKTIASALNLKKIIIPIPLFLWLMVAAISEKLLKKPPLVKRDITSIAQDIVFDSTAARSELGFNPISFAEGVRKSL